MECQGPRFSVAVVASASVYSYGVLLMTDGGVMLNC
jgi:hypothetical protein